jgi:hypothetical protein
MAAELLDRRLHLQQMGGNPGDGAFADLVAAARKEGIVVTSGNAPLTELFDRYQAEGMAHAGVELHAGGWLTGRRMVEYGHLGAVDGGWLTVMLDQQLYLRGFLPVVPSLVSANYGFAGFAVNTGAGVTPDTVTGLVPPIEKGIRQARAAAAGRPSPRRGCQRLSVSGRRTPRRSSSATRSRRSWREPSNPFPPSAPRPRRPR